MAIDPHPDPSDSRPTPTRQNAPYAPPPEPRRLIDALFREELIAARAMAPEDKAVAGQELFEAACRITMAGIRHQHPRVSEEQCREILRQRLTFLKTLEEAS